LRFHQRESPDLLADRLILTLEDDPRNLDEQIARICKKSLPAARRVALSLFERKRYDAAIRVLKGLLKLSPSSGTLYSDLASVYAASGQPEQAEQCLHQARELDPLIGR
jgi:Flp pilus assembly protein TadD